MDELTKEDISLIVSSLDCMRYRNEKLISSISDRGDVDYFKDINSSINFLINKINSEVS